MVEIHGQYRYIPDVVIVPVGKQHCLECPLCREGQAGGQCPGVYRQDIIDEQADTTGLLRFNIVRPQKANIHCLTAFRCRSRIENGLKFVSWS